MYVALSPRRVAHKCRITMQYSSTAVQPVQQQYSRFAVLVQQYSQYSCTRIGQRRLYFSTAVQHSTAVQQYSSSTAVQQTAGAQGPRLPAWFTQMLPSKATVYLRIVPPTFGARCSSLLERRAPGGVRCLVLGRCRCVS